MATVTEFPRRDSATQVRSAPPYSETNWDASLMSKQLWFARLNAAWRYKWIIVIALIAGITWGI